MLTVKLEYGIGNAGSTESNGGLINDLCSLEH